MYMALIQNHRPGGELLLQQPTPRICFLPPRHHSGDAKQDFRSSKKIWELGGDESRPDADENARFVTHWDHLQQEG